MDADPHRNFKVSMQDLAFSCARFCEAPVREIVDTYMQHSSHVSCMYVAGNHLRF